MHQWIPRFFLAVFGVLDEEFSERVGEKPMHNEGVDLAEKNLVAMEK